MATTQEIVEKSVYAAILFVLKENGLTLDPQDYYPQSEANASKYAEDKTNIISDKGYFVGLYGNSNNQVKGEKEVPRVVIVMNGFYPGEIGYEKTDIDKSESGYIVSEVPYEAIDQFIDIRLVYKDVNQGRLLHKLINRAIPQRGYIKPYTNEEAPFDGNLFITLSNYFSNDDMDKGLIEKVYQFTIKDTLLDDPIILDEISGINSIDVTLNDITNFEIKS